MARRVKRTKSYDLILQKELADPRLAAEYLSSSIEDGSMELFLMALRNVAKVHGGPGVIAGKSKLNRQNLYKTLTRDGNPRFSTVIAILSSLGIHLSFAAQSKQKRAA